MTAKLTKIQPKKIEVKAADDIVQKLAVMARDNFAQAWDNPEAADAADYERSRGFQPIGKGGTATKLDQFGAEVPAEQPAEQPAPEQPAEQPVENVEQLVEQAVAIVTEETSMDSKIQREIAAVLTKQGRPDLAKNFVAKTTPAVKPVVADATMTRQHFQLIADVCKELSSGARKEVAEKFADKLATTNPGFNRDRFLKACGV